MQAQRNGPTLESISGFPSPIPVAFVLHEGILFSQRNEELPVFRLQRRRMRTRIGYVSDCFDLRSDILDTQRALTFLMQIRVLSHNQQNDAKQILRNIESLNSHTAFLFDKINFLMDATIGFININQNKRVNQPTFFGVVFMPINILAGIGGCPNSR